MNERQKKMLECSPSNLVCLRRKCPYAEFLYLLDESTPEVLCKKDWNKE